MKFRFITLALLTFSTFASAQDQINKIKNAAEKYKDAFLSGDVSTTVSLMYYKYIGVHGGRDSLIRSIENDNKKNKAQNFKLKEITIGIPSQIVKYGDTSYSVVPEKVLIQLEQATYSVESTLLAISWDNGNKWEFAPTGDRKWLFSAIPAASKLELPELKQPQLVSISASDGSLPLTPSHGETTQMQYIGRRAIALVVVTRHKEFMADTNSMKLIKQDWIKSMDLGAFQPNPNDTVKYGRNAVNGVNRYIINDKKHPEAYLQISKAMPYIGPAKHND